MTPAEFRAIREHFGLSAQEFGVLCGFKKGGAGRTVRRLEAGDIDVSGTLEKLIVYMVRDTSIPKKMRPRD